MDQQIPTNVERPPPDILSVKMFSRLPDASRNTLENWPQTAFYQTIATNIVGDGIGKNVAKAIEQGQNPENQVFCECQEGTDCANNLNCKCRCTAEKVAGIYTAQRLTQSELIDATVDNFFWSKLMFACGPRCSCKGMCSQNGLQNVDKNHNEKFVIVRRNEKGFCLYTKQPISKGEPVLAFTGELTGYNGIARSDDDQQYSFLLYSTGEQEKIGWLFHKKHEVIRGEESYRKVLQKAYIGSLWIDPLKRGNCSRFLSHSCDANLDMKRVFQGGFSPLDVRIVFFAIKDIPANDELVFNYGDTYKQAHLNNNCLCLQCVPSTDDQIPLLHSPCPTQLQSPVRFVVENVNDFDDFAFQPSEELDMDNVNIEGEINYPNVEQPRQHDNQHMINSDNGAVPVQKVVATRMRGRPCKIRRQWPVPLEERRKRQAERANAISDNENDEEKTEKLHLTRSRMEQLGITIPSLRDLVKEPEVDPNVKRSRGRPQKHKSPMILNKNRDALEMNLRQRHVNHARVETPDE